MLQVYKRKKGKTTKFLQKKKREKKEKETDQEPRNSVVTGKHDEVTEDGFPFSASGSPNLTELTVTRYALVLARNR